MVHMSNTFFVEMNRFVYTNRLHCCINTHPNIKFLNKKPIVFLVIQKKTSDFTPDVFSLVKRVPWTKC